MADRPNMGMTTHPILLILFFLSGASALMYQVAWIHMLDGVFGVSAFALATILAAYMAGLSIGALYFGKRADKSANPVALFALLEIGIGIFGILSQFFLPASSSIYSALYRQFHSNMYLLGVFRFFLCFSLLIIPTLLMGGTMPVFSKFFIKKINTVGNDIGNLYTFNNLGAAMGCFAAGFFLIQKIGVKETLFVAAFVNFAIAGTVMLLNKSSDREHYTGAGGNIPVDTSVSVQNNHTVQYPKAVVMMVLCLFALEGFISLIYEIVWIRMLSASILSNSVYSFTIVTSNFICGLAIGGFIVSKFVKKIKNPLAIFAVVQMLIGFFALVMIQVFANSWRVATAIIGIFRNLITHDLQLEFLVSFAAMIIPTMLMGAAFPLVSMIIATSRDRLGDEIGKVNFFDTTGAVLGAFAASFVFIYLFGLQNSILFLAWINLLIGSALMVFHPSMKKKSKWGFVGVSVCCYIFAYLSVPSNTLFLQKTSFDFDAIWYKEDVASTVSVIKVKNGDRLQVNSTTVAGTSYDLVTTQKIQAHLPMLLYKAAYGQRPQKTLQIGLGSGGTSYSTSLHKPKEMTAVELVSGVATAAKLYFKNVNNNIFDNPAYNLIIEDGVCFVRNTNKKYDVIMTESVHPKYAGNANLYTRDYFENCRKSLTENGLVSVWLPIYSLSIEDMKMVLRTFQEVFPNTTVWITANCINKQIQLIGSLTELKIDYSLWELGINEEKIRKDLSVVDLDNPAKLLDSYLAGGNDIAMYAKGALVHTENNPYLEYYAPRAYKVTESWRDNVAELMALKKDALPLIDKDKAGNRYGEIKESLQKYSASSKHILAGTVYILDGNWAKALNEFKAAHNINPQDETVERFITDGTMNSII